MCIRDSSCTAALNRHVQQTVMLCVFFTLYSALLLHARTQTDKHNFSDFNMPLFLNCLCVLLMLKSTRYTSLYRIFITMFCIIPGKPPDIEVAQGDYPTVVRQTSGKLVPIVHAYAYAKYLGNIMLEFTDNGNLITYKGNPILLDASIEEGKPISKYLSIF